MAKDRVHEKAGTGCSGINIIMSLEGTGTSVCEVLKEF
jgi:hypothetical protein